MDPARSAALLCLLALAPAGEMGQVPDASAERARLGNQRIQAEAERRAKEEAAASGLPTSAPTAAAEQTAPMPASSYSPSPEPTGSAAPPARNEPPQPAPASSRSAPDPDRTTRALEQLRQLGQLRDAGYLTEEEFQRIKTRIIQNGF